SCCRSACGGGGAGRSGTPGLNATTAAKNDRKATEASGPDGGLWKINCPTRGFFTSQSRHTDRDRTVIDYAAWPDGKGSLNCGDAPSVLRRGSAPMAERTAIRQTSEGVCRSNIE